MRALEPYFADKAILSATGASVSHGLTTPNDLEAQTKRAMIRAASQVIGIVDSSKLDRVTLANFAALSDLSHLVTDWNAAPDILETLEGINVIVARD